MKEKINIKTIGCSLMLLAILLGFSACNNEDDVMEIFNNKTWKLSRIATEKGKNNSIKVCGITKPKRKPVVNCSKQMETSL